MCGLPGATAKDVAADAGAQIHHDLDVPLTASDATVERVMQTALEWARRQRGIGFLADLWALRPRPWDGAMVALAGAAKEAPAFVQKVIANLNAGTTRGQTFDNEISTDETTSAFELSEHGGRYLRVQRRGRARALPYPHQ